MRRKPYRYRQSPSVDFTVEERATLGGLVDRLAAADSVRIQLGRAHPVALPLALKSLRIDPALAGSMVLTTITDVVGFLSFLGLATLFY